MEEREFAMILTIVNRGFADAVVEAAQKAGAKGGTFLHAQGTTNEEIQKFFGISIMPEKEIVITVTTRDKKKEIMQQIAKEAGFSQPGRGISFSIPVDAVAGTTRL